MADGPEVALQKGLIAALRADTGVSALVGTRIYGEPPQGVGFPYLRLDRFDVVSDDTDGIIGHDITFGLAIHARPATATRRVSRAIAAAVRTALHRQEAGVTVTGFTLIDLTYLTGSDDRESDAKSFIVRQAYRALLDSA